MKKQNRRKFLKSVTIGAGSLTLSRFATAQQEGSLPPIISLLLEDSCDSPVDELQTILPTSPNIEQALCIPPKANFVRIVARGAGGAGAGSTRNESGLILTGAAGGNGGRVNAVFRTENINNLTIRVGEGGVAAEAGELGQPGEFGGGAGGTSHSDGATAFAWGPADQASYGAGGGGYSAVLADERIIVVAGGGGGAGGNAPQGANSDGTGGHSTEFSNSNRAGSSGGTFTARGAGGNSNGETFSAFSMGGPGSTGEGAAGAEEGLSGSAGVGFTGGTGGNSIVNLPIIKRGGPGGGGGGGYTPDEFSTNIGAGGGGGAGRGFENTMEVTIPGNGGGGGAGGACFVSNETTLISQIISDGVTVRGGDGGLGGGVAETVLTPPASGSSGSVEITFFEDDPSPT